MLVIGEEASPSLMSLYLRFGYTNIVEYRASAHLP